jgi:hypothetical protein
MIPRGRGGHDRSTVRGSGSIEPWGLARLESRGTDGMTVLSTAPGTGQASAMARPPS